MNVTATTTAERRALRLLGRHLTTKQKIMLRTTGSLSVKGSNGGAYMIHVSHRGAARQVHVRGFCCAAKPLRGGMPLPWPDKVLAFKLAIETDAPGFNRTVSRQTRG